VVTIKVAKMTSVVKEEVSVETEVVMVEDKAKEAMEVEETSVVKVKDIITTEERKVTVMGNSKAALVAVSNREVSAVASAVISGKVASVVASRVASENDTTEEERTNTTKEEDLGVNKEEASVVNKEEISVVREEALVVKAHKVMDNKKDDTMAVVAAVIHHPMMNLAKLLNMPRTIDQASQTCLPQPCPCSVVANTTCRVVTLMNNDCNKAINSSTKVVEVDNSIPQTLSALGLPCRP